MFKTSRLVAGGFILLAAFAFAPARAVDALEMLPDDVIVVVHLDMASLVESELFQLLAEHYDEEVARTTGKLAKFRQATGFDVETDLVSLTIGAASPSGETEAPFYAVVHGNFNHDRITTWAKESSEVTTSNEAGVTTYTLSVAAEDGPPPTLAWIDSNTMIVATAPDFARMARVAGGNGPNAKSSPLAPVLRQATGQMYLALRIPEEMRQTKSADAESPAGMSMLFSQLQSPQAGPMQSVQTILITLEADSGLDMSIHAAADTAQNGKLLHDMLNSYLGMGKMMVGENPQAVEFLNQIRLEQEGTLVKVSASMSNEAIRAAIAAQSDRISANVQVED